MISPATARLADLEHPWLGLESFREETRAYFFGRDNEIADIHLRLRSHPLLVLYGRSGLGKTSILTAGLLPRLRAEGKNPLLVRLRYEEPSADPLVQLLAAVFQEKISPNEWLQELSAKLALPLPQDPASLLWLRLHYRAELPITTHLILDQFEEVFTVGTRRPNSDSEVRDALAIFLQGSLPEPISQLVAEHDTFSDHFDPDSVPVRVILALRDDYVYALNRWRRHLSALGQNSFELRSLRGAAALDAVFKPGELGCHYRIEVKEENRAETGLPPIIDEETARRIIRFVAKKGVDVPIDEIEAVPPILSLLCRELNERRFVTAPPAPQIVFREDDADIGSIISAFYERCLTGKPEAVRIFVEEELVSVSGTRLPQDEGSILRVFTKGCDIPGAVDGRRATGFGDPAAARACLHELVNDRLLNSLGGEVPVYELIHDLIAGVAEKSRTAREQRFEKEEAQQRAQNEKQAKEKAEAQVRRARNTALLISALLILAIIAGVIGYAQKKKAEAATARARFTRDAAEEVIEFMSFNLRDKLRPLGQLGLLHDVNERVRKYYDSFKGEDETPDILRRRGVVFSNQGSVEFDLGDLDEAEGDFRAFLAISEKLCRQNPDNSLWQRDLALAHADLGSIEYARGDLEAALAQRREALSVHERLVRRTPEETQVKADLAGTHVAIGEILVAKGNLSDALQNYQDAIAIQQELAAKDPEDIAQESTLCVTYDSLGNVETMRGNLDGALQDFQRSFSKREELAKKNPGDLPLQWALSISDMNLAGAQKAQGDVAAATRSYDECLAIRKRLCEQDPQNTAWLRGLAETFENIGELQRLHGDLNGALHNAAEGLTRRLQLYKRDPNNADWEGERASSFTLVGDIHTAAGRLGDAFKTFSDALEIRRRLLGKHPGNAMSERETFVCYDRIGEVQQTRGKLPEALVNFRQFAAMAEKLVHDDPTNAESQSALCYAYTRVGEAIHQQGDYAGALQTFRKILEMREGLAQRDPRNVDWQWNLVETRNSIADMFVHEGDAPNALETLRPSLVLAEKLSTKDSGNMFHRWDIAILYGHLAKAHALQNDFPEAIKEANTGLGIREALSEQDRGNAELQLELATAFNELGHIQLKANDAIAAGNTFKKCRELLDQLDASAPENAERLRQNAINLHGLGDVLRMSGDLAGAMKNYREALTLREGLTQHDQTNAFWQGDLAETCWRMGTTQLQLDPKTKSEVTKLIERGREILRDLKARTSLTAEQQSWFDGMEADLAKLHATK